MDVCTDGSCDSSELEAGTCLIEGTCAVDGDESPTNPCQVCDSSVDTTATTAAPDSEACQGGEPVPEPEPDVIEDAEADAIEEIAEDIGPEDVAPAEDAAEPEDAAPAEDVDAPEDAAPAEDAAAPEDAAPVDTP